MGGIFETIHYDHAVTALQFDSRKIIAAAGENGVKVIIDNIYDECIVSHLYNFTDIQPDKYSTIYTAYKRTHQTSRKASIYGPLSCNRRERCQGQNMVIIGKLIIMGDEMQTTLVQDEP